MKVTVHEKTSTEGHPEQRWEGMRENVYELKIELEGTYEHPDNERIEIAYDGVFYHLEPGEDGLAISVVGVPAARMSVSPQSANAITVSGRQKRKGS